MNDRAESPPATPNRPLWPPYLQLLLPLVLTHVLQGVGGIVDGVWIGRLLGTPGIATVSAFFPVFFVILSIIVGMSAAVSVLVGRAFGRQDLVAMRQVAATALGIALAIGVALALAGALGAGALMRLLGTPTDIEVDATRYATVALLGMPLTFILWTCMALSRGAGDPVSPMWAIAAATAVGAVATPAWIEGWGVLPALGILGAAVSGLLAQGVAFACLLWRWRRAAHPMIAAGWRAIATRAQRPVAREIMRIGLPSSLQMLSMALAEMVLLGIVNRHGSAVTAAYGAATQLLSWIQFPAMCLGIAASILGAHVVGAGRAHRLPAVLATGLWVNAVVTTAFAAAGHVFAPAALSLFLSEPAVREMAVVLMRTVAWSVVLLGWSNVIVATLRAGGVVFAPTALGMLAIFAVELPVATMLEARLGIAGVWWAYPAAFAAMLLLQAGYVLAAWRHPPAQSAFVR